MSLSFLLTGHYLQEHTPLGQWNLTQLEAHHWSMPGLLLHRPTARHTELPAEEGGGRLVVVGLVWSRNTNPDCLLVVVLCVVILVVVAVVLLVVVVVLVVVVDLSVDCRGAEGSVLPPVLLVSLASTLQVSVKHSTMRLVSGMLFQWRSITVKPTPSSLRLARPEADQSLELLSLQLGLVSLVSSLHLKLKWID